jgi:hypothetical protein
MSPARLSNYGPSRGPRARPMGRPGTTRNSNGPARPEIQTIRIFSGLGRAGPGGTNVHLYFSTWRFILLYYLRRRGIEATFTRPRSYFFNDMISLNSTPATTLANKLAALYLCSGSDAVTQAGRRTCGGRGNGVGAPAPRGTRIPSSSTAVALAWTGSRSRGALFVRVGVALAAPNSPP